MSAPELTRTANLELRRLACYPITLQGRPLIIYENKGNGKLKNETT